MIVQVERRKHIRLMIDEHKCHVKFFKTMITQRVKTQIFEKNCFDISSGGFSFVTAKTESKFFELGEEILGIELAIGADRTHGEWTHYEHYGN
jgi:hypothetical protein